MLRRFGFGNKIVGGKPPRPAPPALIRDIAEKYFQSEVNPNTDLDESIHQISLATRICKAELPYLRNFCAYYRAAGVKDVVFILSQKDFNYGRLRKAISEIFPDAKYYVYEDNSINNIFYDRFWREKEFRQMIEGVWCLFCDVDEFLILDQNGSIGSLLKSLSGSPISALMLNWNVLACDADTNRNGEVFSGRYATYGKSLVRRENIKGFENEHIASLNGGFYMSGCILNAGLVHVWGRSVNDTILKIHLQQDSFQQRFGGTIRGHILGKSESALPKRLKVHAFMAKFFKGTPVPGISCRDEELEKELISEILSRVDAEEVEQRYYAYKNSLDNRLANYSLGMDLRMDSRPIKTLADLLP